jgi:hypothetical protein
MLLQELTHTVRSNEKETHCLGQRGGNLLHGRTGSSTEAYCVCGDVCQLKQNFITDCYKKEMKFTAFYKNCRN